MYAVLLSSSRELKSHCQPGKQTTLLINDHWHYMEKKKEIRGWWVYSRSAFIKWTNNPAVVSYGNTEAHICCAFCTACLFGQATSPPPRVCCMFILFWHVLSCLPPHFLSSLLPLLITWTVRGSVPQSWDLFVQKYFCKQQGALLNICSCCCFFPTACCFWCQISFDCTLLSFREAEKLKFQS